MNEERKRKSDEWELREKEWNREMRIFVSKNVEELKLKKRKFNPKNRFRLMLVCLGVFLTSGFILWLTMFNPDASLQGVASLFTTIISGIVFVMNYGKDVTVTIINSLSKNSLR